MKQLQVATLQFMGIIKNNIYIIKIVGNKIIIRLKFIILYIDMTKLNIKKIKKEVNIQKFIINEKYELKWNAFEIHIINNYNDWIFKWINIEIK